MTGGEAVTSWRPLAAVLVSIVAAVLIVATHRRPDLRDGLMVVGALAKFGVVASMIPGVLDGESYEWSLGMVPGLREEFLFGVAFALRADALGLTFASLASFLWVFTAFYAIGYMRGTDADNQTRFFAAFAASLAAAIGIAFATNVVMLFVFYELLSIVTYPLVAHDETEEARTAGRKYLAYTFFGGGFLVLAGAAIVFSLTGTTALGDTAQGLAAADPTLARLGFVALAAGFGVKAALMPVHSWLPDAMVAPTPVSGLLHAVAVVKSGAFGIARVVLDVYELPLVEQLGMGLPLAAAAAATIVTASVIALRQDRLKARLAYSTVSQLSYILLGLALLGQSAITGALLHIPAHAFMKLTLFFAAGIIHVETHTDYISEMDGIGKRMPVTMTAFAIAAAGMAGIPLIAGFVSKWYLLVGAVSVGQGLFAVALLVSGVLNIAYFWPIVYGAFFESHDRADTKPLLEGPFGGSSSRTVTDGGPDGDRELDGSVRRSERAHESDHTHHGGPGPNGWERVGWTGNEGSWLMLGPIVLVVTGAVVLGIVPGQTGFLDLIEIVTDRVVDSGVSG